MDLFRTAFGRVYEPDKSEASFGEINISLVALGTIRDTVPALFTGFTN